MSGWSDLWDVVTGKSQAESDAADRKLRELNDAAYQSGRITREVYDTTNAHIDQQAQDTVGLVVEDARRGALDGANVIADTIRTTANGVAETAGGFVWRAVPWWVWLLALAYVAWQFGLVRRLAGKAIA